MKKLKLKLKLKKPTKKIINIAVKLSLGAVLFSALFLTVFLSTGPSQIQFYEGDISLKDIYAPYDFTYTGDIDEATMKDIRGKVLERVDPIYRINPKIEERISQTISSFFSQVDKSRQIRELIGVDEKIESIKEASDLNLSDETYRTLIRKSRDVDYIERVVYTIVNEALKKGIVSGSDKESLKKDGTTDITLFDPSSGMRKKVAIDLLLTIDDFNKEIDKSITEYFPHKRRSASAVSEIVKTVVQSNLQFSPEETKNVQDELLAKLPLIYKKSAIKKNEIIIGKGEKVTKRHLKILRQLEKMREMRGRSFYLVGMALLLIIFLLISVFHLRLYEYKVFQSNKNLVLISFLVLFIAITAQAVAASPLSSYFIPLASVSMLMAILVDSQSAFIFTIMISMLIGVLAGNNFGLMIVMFIGSSVGIYSVRRVRRRSRLLLGGLLVGVANFSTIVALGFLNNLSPRLFLTEGVLGVVNGLLSFLLVMGLLPIFEYIFKIITDITLLELSDLNHPLLKQMATEAPGTYHHSLIVGNLVEAACDAIGANSLLARVGAYYHDIGKIEKAEYFSENEGEPKNSRHASLTPSMSALVIINHVRDGVELAHRYKLNPALMDFIGQHHGNGLIYYFYQRALEKATGGQEINDEEFRYPGPRPQTKETAIVLLADSVEASSRTLGNPTPSRVQGLVQRIINNKFIDGQLDECDLTLKDLHKISEAFMRILNAMFHTRVEYPDEEEMRKQKGGKNNHKKPDQKADTGELFNKKDSAEGPKA